ncbi:MAG: undecaprenyldiphospho-muramoylpentapeptide beta-N-acetylglucosaminyltransferase, partial [Candidatus Aenigmatarchaeota archaeon]
MRLLICGGGTGGHLFPAISIAEEFIRMRIDGDVTFLGSEKGIEARILPKEGWKFIKISTHAFEGKGILEKSKSAIILMKGISQCIRIIKKLNADVVLGVGGYVSVPGVIAGWMVRKKTAIHEQNSIPGIANRFLGKIVDRIFITFPESRSFFPEYKVLLTGLPVRRRFIEATVDSAKENDRFTLFVFGGSQGSHRINEKMVEALDFLGDIKQEIRIIHQTGEKDRSFVEECYRKKGFDADVRSFIYDMADVLKSADLIICRSGASSIAEICLSGKPSILIPYPYAAHNHQELNALYMVKNGASLMIRDNELTGSLIASQ